MARFTPGAVLAALSGSVGGLTFGRGRTGPVLRSLSSRSFKPSAIMAATSANLVLAAQTWKGFAEPRRRRWSTAATLAPRVDALGRSYTLTGYAYYVEVACRALASGLVAPADPPARVVQPSPVITFGNVNIAAGVLQVARGPSSPNVQARILSMSRPFSPGIGFMHHVETRIVAMGAGTGNANRYAGYSAAWFPLRAEHIGMRVIVRLTNVGGQGIDVNTLEQWLTLT
jgi:hypothetical protein